MPQGRALRILLVQENIQSARYTRFLLEEAGYLVDWRPAITPDLLRTESLSDAVLFDFHCLDREELAGQRLMREHPRWRAVPSLVAAIAATSADLQAAMQAGTFLPELYHRLALIEVCLPPLRLRRRILKINYRTLCNHLELEGSSSSIALYAN